MNKNHIALITDDNYCLPTIVCIKSIITYCSDTDIYVIHVCTFGLSHSNIEKFEALCNENVTVTIDLFNGAEYEEKLKQISQKTHVTPTALIKFELPNYFANIGKLLYLDGDIIIKKNIDELLDLDLGNHYLAASYEFYSRLDKINYSFSRDYNDFYFNSGVMLLNLNQMRIDGITKKLWYYKINLAKTRLMDQESLNAVCGNNVFPLSIEWNFNPVFCNERYIKEINNVYKTNIDSVRQLEENVRIIHYVGKEDKPWIYKDAKFRQYWDQTLNMFDKIIQLDLKTFERTKPTFIESANSKIEKHGVIGFFCFLLNKILHRTLI